jgi:hypothetical protein
MRQTALLAFYRRVAKLARTPLCLCYCLKAYYAHTNGGSRLKHGHKWLTKRASYIYRHSTQLQAYHHSTPNRSRGSIKECLRRIPQYESAIPLWEHPLRQSF